MSPGQVSRAARGWYWWIAKAVFDRLRTVVVIRKSFLYPLTAGLLLQMWLQSTTMSGRTTSLMERRFA